MPHNSLEKPGYGVMTYHNDDKYDGQWNKGKKHGKGKRTNKDGSSYEGQYENDKPNGKGTYIWAGADPGKYTG